MSADEVIWSIDVPLLWTFILIRVKCSRVVEQITVPNCPIRSRELSCVVLWCDVVVVHECVVVHTSSMQWQTLSCVLWVGLWSRGIIQLIWVISDASIQFVGVVCCVVEMWLPSKALRNVVHELLCYVSWHAAQAMRTSHSTSILLNSTLFI